MVVIKNWSRMGICSYNMTMKHLYDSIGHGYRPLRQPDQRINQAIHKALGTAESVLNVGAGAGSYEPEDRPVTAVELAMTMIRQRPKSAAPVVQANSMALPFADDSFAASLAILTVHHWQDQAKGLAEMRRVARERVAILTWDRFAPGFWLTDYFPEIQDIDRIIFPTFEQFESALGPIKITEVSIPHDCTDGFLGAYWRRPEAYLDARVPAAISTFAKITGVEQGMQRLRDDLDSGAWLSKNEALLKQTNLDLGYRLVTANY